MTSFPAGLGLAMWLMTACCLGQQTSSRDVHLPEAPSAVNRSDSDQQLPSERLIAQETQAGAQQTLSKDPDDHVSMATKIEDLPIEWLIGPYIPVQGKLTPLTLQERRNVYFRQTYLTVGSYLARAFAAGIDQARGTPYEWGGGFPGYGRRFASRYGQYVISNTIVAAGNAGLGYEPRYDFCRCKGFWPRTKHAVARNFYTYNETEHEKRPQIPLYVGSFAAGAISTTWLPGQQNAWKNGAYSALQQVGYGSGINFVSEFAIDILQKLKVRKR